MPDHFLTSGAAMKPGGILSSTIEACPFGAVVFIESLGVIVLANSEVERMFGYGHDELIGQTIDILVPTILREAEGEDPLRYPRFRKSATSRNASLPVAARTAANFRSKSASIPFATKAARSRSA